MIVQHRVRCDVGAIAEDPHQADTNHHRYDNQGQAKTAEQDQPRRYVEIRWAPERPVVTLVRRGVDVRTIGRDRGGIVSASNNAATWVVGMVVT